MTFCTVCVCSVASPGTEFATWSPTFTSLIGLLEPSAISTPVPPTKLWQAPADVFPVPAEGLDAGAASAPAPDSDSAAAPPPPEKAAPAPAPIKPPHIAPEPTAEAAPDREQPSWDEPHDMP